MAHTEAPISITVKTAAGSLVTVRAEHGDELDQIVANGLAAITSATQELETAIRGTAPATVTQNLAASLGAQVIDTQYHAPEVPQSAPIVGSITGARGCAHGKMTAIQGLGKDGKPYKGWFCPAPKGAFDKCKNQYVKVTDLEWNTFVPDQVK